MDKLTLDEIIKINQSIKEKYDEIEKLKRTLCDYYDEVNDLKTKLKKCCEHKIVIEHVYNEKIRYCSICGIDL